MEKIKSQKEPYVVPIPNSLDILRLIIPAYFVFGRQRMDEYDNKKRQFVERGLKEKGLAYLLDYPALLVALFCRDLAQLVLIDGHHRTRYAPNCGIRQIPCCVAPLPVVAETIFRQSPKECEDTLMIQISETLISFNCLPDTKKPKTVQGVANMQQLAAMFEAF